ncbi:uncharacterized protein LOC144119174 [Amblyomma americanum]
MTPSVAVSIPICVASWLFFVTSGVCHIPEDTGRTRTTLYNNGPLTRNPRIFTDVYNGGHRMAEVFLDRKTGRLLHCNVLGDRFLISHILKSAHTLAVIHATPHKMNHLLHLCLNLPPNRKIPENPRPTNHSLHSLSIFPGTKWCGAGNVATNVYDLGKARDSDMCCRDHDHSKDVIPAFRQKYGIKNHRFYTMTNCAEDRKLFNCFLNVGSFTSVSLGVTFFDILKTRCFEYGYPTKCARYKYSGGNSRKKSCQVFIIDASKRRKWRVFRPPNFLKAFMQAKKGKNITAILWLSDDMKV